MRPSAKAELAEREAARTVGSDGLFRAFVCELGLFRSREGMSRGRKCWGAQKMDSTLGSMRHDGQAKRKREKYTTRKREPGQGKGDGESSLENWREGLPLFLLAEPESRPRPEQIVNLQTLW